jgi:hypothetical protein
MNSRPTTGNICKGSNYDKRTMDNFDKAKHMDLQVFTYLYLIKDRIRK